MTSPVVDHGPASEAVEVESPDQTITRTTKVLLAHHGLKPPMLEELILGLKKSTVYRRFDEGGWSASEVAALAALFNVPVGAFYSGLVTPAESKLADHALRLSRQHETAGQEHFSGSDIDRFLDAVAESAGHAA